MPSRSSALEVGSVLGNYTITRELGRGGMGAVFEAQHNTLKKTVAIKVLLTGDDPHPDIQARFLREGESASRVRHPNVVDITDFGEHEGTPFLVMEFLKGEDLEALLRRRDRLRSDETADLLLPVISALTAAHAVGVVHRDLKPANIFLTRGHHGQTVPKLVDFGISKVATEGIDGRPLTATGALIGTPQFMSPEQVEGLRDLDWRSDQYALGVILYCCLTGQMPFPAPNIFTTLAAIGMGRFDPPRSLEPSIPEALEGVVLRAMRTKPADRFGSMPELAQALLPWASDRVRREWEESHPAWERETEPGAERVPTEVLPAGDADGSRSRNPSTIGRSAVELDGPLPPAPRGRSTLVAAGVGLLAVVALAVAGAAVAHRSPAERAAAPQRPSAPVVEAMGPSGRAPVAHVSHPPHAVVEPTPAASPEAHAPTAVAAPEALPTTRHARRDRHARSNRVVAGGSAASTPLLIAPPPAAGRRSEGQVGTNGAAIVQ